MFFSSQKIYEISSKRHNPHEKGLKSFTKWFLAMELDSVTTYLLSSSVWVWALRKLLLTLGKLKQDLDISGICFKT